MSVQVRFIVSLVAFGCCVSSLAAQTASHGEVEDPILQSVIKEALERNPELLAAREVLEESRARPAQAEALPDPMFSVSYLNEGWAPSLGSRDLTTLGLMWTQDLPYPGKRAFRGQVLSLEADLTAQQVDRARLTVIAAVRRAYFALVHTREELPLIEEHERTWNRMVSLTRERYAAGQGTQQDLLRAQIEEIRIQRLKVQRRAEIATRLAELNRLMARPYDAPLETPAHFELRPLRQSLEQVLEEAYATSPELKSAEVAIERDRAAVELARRNYKPDFSVQAGYQNRGGLDGMWQAGLGIRLPVYGKKNAAGLAEAQARQRASAARLEGMKLLLRQRTQERLAQARATEETIELFSQGIIPQDKLATEAALATYQTGQVSLLPVLETLATTYSDRETHLGLLLAHENLRISLEEASLEGDGQGLFGSETERGMR